MEQKNTQNIFARSPTLETVMMIEKTIKENSGELNKTELWKKLPRKVMWQTYSFVLDYLQEINKIGVAKNRILVYIWNPKIAKKYMSMKNIKYE